MSAAAVLARARAAGVAVGLEGGNLRLRGAAQPPAELLAELRMHKAEVVALLTAPRLGVAMSDSENGQKCLHNDETAFCGPPADPLLPDAAWVEAMAAALLANPVYHRVTDHEAGMVYFRGRALARISHTNQLHRGSE